MKRPITHQRLRELVEYDPGTGVFTRRTDFGRWGKFKAGTVIGTTDHEGYLVAALDGVQYRLHRLAFTYMTNEWLPEAVQIDHVNGCKSDNRWRNLRRASNQQNAQNRAHANTSEARSSKLLGVYWHKKSGRWMARIKVNYRSIYLGLFADEGEAHQAYLAAKARMHEFAPKTNQPHTP